jgi:hypothetical protein
MALYWTYNNSKKQAKNMSSTANLNIWAQHGVQTGTEEMAEF